MLRLRYDTPLAWSQMVLDNLDAFLQDHANNERKVAQAALTMAAHNAQYPEIVDAMIELAHEELTHFSQVHDLLKERGVGLGQDQPDPYMGPLHKLIRKGDRDAFLLDRLLVFGVVEARGCERFRMVSEALPEGDLKEFYLELTRCEARHHGLFTRLARIWFDEDVVVKRLDEILEHEATVVRKLPLRPALH